MGRFKSLLFSQKRMLWTIPGLYAYFQDFPLLFIISVVLFDSLSIVLSKKHNEVIEKEECFHFHLTCNIILQCYFIQKWLPVWQRCFNIRPVPNHSFWLNESVDEGVQSILFQKRFRKQLLFCSHQGLVSVFRKFFVIHWKQKPISQYHQ